MEALLLDAQPHLLDALLAALAQPPAPSAPPVKLALFRSMLYALTLALHGLGHKLWLDSSSQYGSQCEGPGGCGEEGEWEATSSRDPAALADLLMHCTSCVQDEASHKVGL